jgi:hypothetical protein
MEYNVYENCTLHSYNKNGIEIITLCHYTYMDILNCKMAPICISYQKYWYLDIKNGIHLSYRTINGLWTSHMHISRNTYPFFLHTSKPKVVSHYNYYKND